ncbi:tyrosine-type recombinase/integrase [Paenibacillus sp. D51F]
MDRPETVSLIQQLTDTHLLSPSIIQNLVNPSYYDELSVLVSSSEDHQGNYDYTQMSNIGMVYLFLHRRGRKRSERTKMEYARELHQFLCYLSDYGIGDIRELKRGQMESYQQWLEVQYSKKKTQAKKLAILSSFLAWCYEENYLERDLKRGLSSVQLDRSQIPDREISPASLEAGLLYYDQDPKFKSLLLLIASTGLRLNEVITPVWGDLYFDSIRKQHYVKTITKRLGTRHAVVQPAVLEELMEYRRRLGLSTTLSVQDKSPFYPNKYGRPYTLTSLSAIVTKKLAAANVVTVQEQKATAHYFRHYFARSAFNNGASIEKIAATLDHSSIRTTEQNYLSRELKKENDISHLVDIPGISARKDPS